MKHAGTIAWSYFKIGSLASLQYRSDAFHQLSGGLFSIGAGLAGIGLVLEHTDELRGWSGADLVIVLGVYQLLHGLMRLVVLPSLWHLPDQVQDGRFDTLLLKPADSQLLQSVAVAWPWRSLDVFAGAAMIWIGARHSTTFDASPESAAAFLVMLAAGLAAVYSFWVLVASLSFRLIQMNQAMGAFNSVFEAARWPVSVYPPTLRYGMTFLLPAAFAVTVPAQSLTGKLTLAAGAGALAWGITLLVISRLVWRRAIRSYSGASA